MGEKVKIKDLEAEELFGLIVPYEYAVNWVAFGDFEEPSIEPRKLHDFTHNYNDIEEKYTYLSTRFELASEHLQSQCFAGNIRCYGQKSISKERDGCFEIEEGEYQQVPAPFFLKGEWGLSDWEPEDGDVIENEEFAYTNVLVNIEDLRRIFPKSVENYNKQVTQIAAPQFTAKLERRGRKTKYKWEDFLTEIIVFADLDGIPDTQAKLEKKMAQWCVDNWGEEPSISVVRKRVSKIYNHERKKEV